MRVVEVVVMVVIEVVVVVVSEVVVVVVMEVVVLVVWLCGCVCGFEIKFHSRVTNEQAS